MDIEKLLLKNQDIEYKKFHSRLMPTIPEERIIGIRIPVLKNLLKQIKNEEYMESFLKALPHKYYEENNLHAFYIAEISDYDLCIEKLEEFLPYVDNWATCDSMRPRCFLKNTDRLIKKIRFWLTSSHPYTVRFGIEMLMVCFLGNNFSKEHLSLVAKVKSDEYYVNMMIAWYFATALAKQWDDAILVLKSNSLDKWVHNKTIQKGIESYRISDDKKEYLKSLRMK